MVDGMTTIHTFEAFEVISRARTSKDTSWLIKDREDGLYHFIKKRHFGEEHAYSRVQLRLS